MKRSLIISLILALAFVVVMPPGNGFAYDKKKTTVENLCVTNLSQDVTLSPTYLEVTVSSCAICTGEEWVYMSILTMITFKPQQFDSTSANRYDYTCKGLNRTREDQTQYNERIWLSYGLARTC